MGRRKIEIKPIRDDRNRSVTFLKRKGGLFKKAHELSVLCQVEVAVIIFGHNKKLYEYSSHEITDTINRFQYYGGAHEHKGPQDFIDKAGGGDDDDDDDVGVDDGGEGGADGSVEPQQHPMMHAQMQNHPGFQHVRHGTPSNSPPMPNGATPQFQRGPSPLPPGMGSRPGSRTAHHPGHIRRTSSGLAPPGHPHYAYTPNPPFYQPPQGSTYPPPYAVPQAAGVQAVQQAYMQDNRRASMPPGYAQPARPASHQDHLQPPPPHARMPSPQPPRPSAPPMPQPKPLPAHAKNHSIFTPIDDSRSMLAAHWGLDGQIKQEPGPRAASIDVAAMQRGKPSTSNNASPQFPRANLPTTPQPPQRSASSNAVPKINPPSRVNTSGIQIPSEQSGDEGGGTGETNNNTNNNGSNSTNQRVVLPPPSPSANALLSAGAQGPPNPFARPAPPMSTNPHAMNRDAAPPTQPPARDSNSNNIETPISALPSRFMSDNLLPSPSTFYPEWGFGRSTGGGGDGNMLPSPLNFQTPIVGNGGGWRDPAPASATGPETNGEGEDGANKRVKS
ncbi:hypothetical protein K431DRAFT_341792 [Polychaeton citri CBS 116435]|uniref:MADS-box domain-containing protein n=1 Tax=Polychaeton citri CBS 116435 TaxID=1314669 RepID=A0A9P4PZI4_9PEZI|nr:hypothetical protein K431DRAFT_341792 [Polychaeton citri CBS 116435]